LPFDGQGDAAVIPMPKKSAVQPQTSNTGGVSSAGRYNYTPRKQVNQPSGKLSTNNIGIKETLNPRKKKSTESELEAQSDLAEKFTFEELERVWKEYSLSVKRNKRDSLHSILTNVKMTVSSDYQIHLELVSQTQKNEIESVTPELLGCVRSKLKNFKMRLHSTITENQKIEVLDSKGIFDKLAEENSSLNKFRKLFNLDIEF
jgi:hypothetical protein